MHPRNLFLFSPPSFADLSNYDKGFRRHCKPPHYFLDWSNADALRAFGRATLSYYFGISNWSCPKERLCPTIPNRLNYILTCQDLLASFALGGPSSDIAGVPQPLALDVGTGSSSIYSLLGSKIANFRYFGTEIDELSIKSAFANVQNADLCHKIDLIFTAKTDITLLLGTNLHHVPCDTLLLHPMMFALSNLQKDIQGDNICHEAVAKFNNHLDNLDIPSNQLCLQSLPPSEVEKVKVSCINLMNYNYNTKSTLLRSSRNFAFTMCNPPFYRTWEKAVMSMSEARRSAGTGAPIELTYEGGEINFVSRMIMESALLEGYTYKRNHDCEFVSPTTDQFYCELSKQQLQDKLAASGDARLSNADLCDNPSCIRFRDEKNTLLCYNISQSGKSGASLWYTSMVGKQSSLDSLIKIARQASAMTIRVYSLVQGMTMRWVLAWSFLPPLSFLSPAWRYLQASNIDDHQLSLHCAFMQSHNLANCMPCGCIGATKKPSEVFTTTGSDYGREQLRRKRLREVECATVISNGAIRSATPDPKTTSSSTIESQEANTLINPQDDTRPSLKVMKILSKKHSKTGALFPKFLNRKPALRVFVVDSQIMTNTLSQYTTIVSATPVLPNSNERESAVHIQSSQNAKAKTNTKIALCGAQELFVVPAESDVLALAEALLGAKKKATTRPVTYSDTTNENSLQPWDRLDFSKFSSTLSTCVQECFRREHLFHKTDKELQFHITPKCVPTVDLSPWYYLEKCPEPTENEEVDSVYNGSNKQGTLRESCPALSFNCNVERLLSWQVVCAKSTTTHKFLFDIPLFEMELQVLKISDSSLLSHETQSSVSSCHVVNIDCQKSTDELASSTFSSTSPSTTKTDYLLGGYTCSYVVVSMLLKHDPTDNAVYQCWERTTDRLKKYIFRNSRYFRRKSSHPDTDTPK